MARWSSVWVALLLALVTSGAALAQAHDGVAHGEPVADAALSPAAVVGGILLYTRWPSAQQPLRACVSGTGDDSQQLRAQLPTMHVGRPVDVLTIEVDEVPPVECGLIFFDGWNPAIQREVLKGLAQQPVLSVGKGPDFCSAGGLFCLLSPGARARFEVNLDAVSRSGLRVNPQVLRLARPRQGGST